MHQAQADRCTVQVLPVFHPAVLKTSVLLPPQDELNGVVAGAEPIRGRLGIECAGACSAAAAAAARVLPPPLLSAYTLLSAAVRGYGMRATVAVAGARPQQQQSMRPACPSLLAGFLVPCLSMQCTDSVLQFCVCSLFIVWDVSVRWHMLCFQ